MSDPAEDARAVIAHFQRMLGPDGGQVALLALDGPVMRVSYALGDCEDCVLAAEDLGGMMQELLARRRSAITSVEVV